jgi:hypothetical protein
LELTQKVIKKFIDVPVLVKCCRLPLPMHYATLKDALEDYPYHKTLFGRKRGIKFTFAIFDESNEQHRYIRDNFYLVVPNMPRIIDSYKPGIRGVYKTAQEAVESGPLNKIEMAHIAHLSEVIGENNDYLKQLIREKYETECA